MSEINGSGGWVIGAKTGVTIGVLFLILTFAISAIGILLAQRTRDLDAIDRRQTALELRVLEAERAVIRLEARLEKR